MSKSPEKDPAYPALCQVHTCRLDWRSSTLLQDWRQRSWAGAEAEAAVAGEAQRRWAQQIPGCADVHPKDLEFQGQQRP